MNDPFDIINSAEGPLNLTELSRLSGVPKRTLQRLLRQLVENGSVARLGKGPSTRYAARGQTSEPAVTTRIAEIDACFSVPARQRPPKGYDGSLLHSYVPNTDFYLSADVRLQLQSVGTSPRPDSHTRTRSVPAGDSARTRIAA